MEKANRNLGIFFLALSLATAFWGGFVFSSKPTDKSALLFSLGLAIMFGFAAIPFLQMGGHGKVSELFFNSANLKKGKIYGFLSETLVKNNQWLVAILMPNGSTFTFYSQKSLKFFLGDAVKFSIVEGCRIVPLDENGNVPAPEGNGISTSPSLVTSS